jgi:chromosome segregation ATPase
VAKDSRHSESMAHESGVHEPGDLSTDVPSAIAVFDLIEDTMDKEPKPLPTMKELLDDAKRIERHIRIKSDTSDVKQSWSDELEALENEISQMDKGKQREETLPPKPSISFHPFEGNTQKDENYQESYASQIETAELRDEVSSIATRLANLEAIIESLVKERSNLPDHLDRITRDISHQFTIMNDRLNSSIETGLGLHTSQQLVDDVVASSSSITGVLETVRNDLVNPPSQLSSITQSKPITSSKRKIRLIH